MNELVSDFDLFWQAFPKRQKKADARKAWNQLSPDTALVQRILDALVWQKTQPNWLKDGGQFIPLPASWLRGERWEDEPVSLPQFSPKTVNTLRAIYGDRDVH